MCVKDAQEMENLDASAAGSWPLHDLLHTRVGNWDERESRVMSPTTDNDALRASFPLDSISEENVAPERKQNLNGDFVPELRSGEWSDIGGRPYMEDTHVCIGDLAKNYGQDKPNEDVVSFFGVFDGHGGKGAAHFVRDNLPRVIVEDADFPLELEKVVTRSFNETDAAFAKTCRLETALSSGTTALTAMIFGRSLLVANAGDCRAVLSRRGIAVEMSEDHRPCCANERLRIESLGGFIDDGYLNGQLGVTRALGDWHLEGMKEMGEKTGPLSAEPEMKLITLIREDEFLIIGSDGIWDVFSSQNAIDFARKQLQEHNDVRLCCKEVVEEAIKRGATDNLTVVIISFHSKPPSQLVVQRARVRRSISAEGLLNLKFHLEG
ncbi:hypothetical protein MLD38_014958 [Melastoma candidum]|uniref:Uncharacterized protein n=1 Tax=Melastoma candidum TaxID=119954 RepID=A0ACB9RGC9_9MYRT|nr:hypothetical protein MLD38_014958 [Melastoma candidum]